MQQTIIGSDIKLAATLLTTGELVAIPTETVYGLAANGLDPLAIAKIYAAKNRPQFNPLILHIASFDQLALLVTEIPEACQRLISAFSPGPITYLLPKSALVPDIVTAGNNRVAVRIPDHLLTLELLSGISFPLAAPSANPSGYVSPVSAEHVLQGLSGKIPYILDGGHCRVGLESTIVGFEEGKIIIHRLGGITAEDIKMVTNIDPEVRLSHASPTAPGQLKSHYATSKPLLIGNIEQLVYLNPGKRIAVLSFQQSYHNLVSENIVLSSNGVLEEAAAGLFKAMRDMDCLDIDVILAERFPEEGIGRAINDRLERAAYREKR